MTSADGVIGLFPLGLVLLPGEILPLHIFEPRYRKLIGECREAGDAFGVVLRQEDAVSESGCTAVVFEVLEELEDGRLNILIEGRERFRLLELRPPDDEEADYLSASVVYFEDEPEDDVGGPLLEDVVALFRRLADLMGVETPRVPAGRASLSFRLAAAVDFGLPLKQRLLETTSESERLDLLVAVMRGLIPGLELRKEREEAIRGNGKGN